MAFNAREAEVEMSVFGSRRASILPKALQRSSRTVHTGVLHADDNRGLRLAMHNSTRFRRLREALARPSVQVKTLCTIDEIDSFQLVDGSQDKREGLWRLVATVDGKQETYEFKSASVFDAVGWLQALHILRGESPIPVVALLGETGVGKSLLASRLAGLPPDNAVFQVGGGVRSVTEHTDMYVSHWMGDAEAGEVIVIDTPGLSDSQGRDAKHVAEMMNKLAQLGGVHTFLILFNAEQPVLSGSLRAMLDIFETSFGPDFWGHAMLVFTRWYTDEFAQERRTLTQVELAAEWNAELAGQFPAIGQLPRRDKSLQCVFVDSKAMRPDEKARAEAEMRKLSVLARQNRLFDLRSELPDAGAGFTGGKVPEEMSALADLLRRLNLADKLARLHEQGVTEVEVLKKLKDAQLRSMLGWTAEEIARLRDVSYVVDIDSPNYAIVQDFKQLGLPTTELERLGWGATRLLLLSEDEVCAKLGINVAQLSVFSQWRNTVLRHTPVLDENLWPGAIVTRNEMAWPYDDEGVVSQDLGGPGIVLNFMPRVGDQGPVGELSPPPRWTGHPHAYEPPTRPGWARVHWFTTGYSNVYRVGADRRSDIKYDMAAEHGIESADPASVDRAVFADKDFRSAPAASELRCTFGFGKGMKFAHWAKFDVRPSVCRALGGFAPGDVAQMEGSQDINFTCVGASTDAAGKVELWYTFKVGASADTSTGVFQAGTPLRRVGRMRLNEAAHADLQCHADDMVGNETVSEVNEMLEETFPFAVGSTVGMPATFDIRDDVVSRFYGLRHGEQLMLKDKRKLFTVVGVSKHRSDLPRLWLYEEGDPGATIWRGLWEDLGARFERLGRIVALPPRTISINRVFTRPTDVQLRALKLTLDLAFPRGVRHSVMARFDSTPRTCVLLCGHVSGTVLAAGASLELTVIGGAVNEDTGLPTIWFHASGTAGAGILPDFYDLNDAGAFTVAGGLRDLAELRDELMAQQQQQQMLQQHPGGLMELIRRLAEFSGEAPEQPSIGPALGAGDEASEGDDEDFFGWMQREGGGDRKS